MLLHEKILLWWKWKIFWKNVLQQYLVKLRPVSSCKWNLLQISIFYLIKLYILFYFLLQLLSVDFRQQWFVLQDYMRELFKSKFASTWKFCFCFDRSEKKCFDNTFWCNIMQSSVVSETWFQFLIFLPVCTFFLFTSTFVSIFKRKLYHLLHESIISDLIEVKKIFW